jgi:hypothetical protein
MIFIDFSVFMAGLPLVWCSLAYRRVMKNPARPPGQTARPDACRDSAIGDFPSHSDFHCRYRVIKG